MAGLNAVVAHNNKPRPQGGLINLTINPNEPRRLQIGTRINGGVLADWYIQGSKNQYLYMIVYLGEGPMGRITKVYGGGREVYSTPINHGTRTVIPNYRSGGDRLWITYYDGRPGQTADSYLVSQGVGWTSNHVGAGCAYAIVEAWWDSDNQMTPPQLSFEMEGAKLYDRRKDTTAGGSGAHRANDPATWELSSNPAVALDHYLLGRYTGAVKTFGVGLAATDVPYAPFAARANLADENVNRKVSGTLKRYAANGFLFADRSYSDTIRDLCRAMNARPADLGGRIGIIDGEEKTPVMTLADADVIDGVPESYTPKRSWADLVSVVRGTYQNPAQLYQAGEYPRVTDAAWTAADGGSPKEATLDLEMETDVERAQRLATLFARRERRQAQLTGTYALRAIELEQGDWFIRAGGIFGAGKTFEVIDRVLDARSMTVTITAFEVDPADSAWVPSTAIDAPPAAVADTNTLQAMAVPSLTVTGVTLSGTVADLPAIRVQWTAPDDPRVRQIVVEAVPTAGGVPVAQTVDVGTAQVVFTNGITDDTAYLVRARFIGEYIPSAWTGNVAVTTLGDYSVGTATSVPWSGLTGSIPAAVDNALVPFGVNGLSNSGFVNGAAGWKEAWNGTAGVPIYRSANDAGWRGAVQVAYAFSDATPAAGTVFDVWTRNGDTAALARRNLLPVLPGDKVYASALLAKLNATSIALNIGWYNSSGVYISELGAGSVTADSNPVGGVSANMTRVGGFGIAPANAAFANVWARVHCSGAFTPLGFMSEVMLSRVPAGQTAAVPYSPGSADLLADPTIDNTAAAITGQGAFATVNTAGYGSALLTGFGTLAPLGFTTLGTNVRRADGATAVTDATAITALGTAAAITGQGSFATLSAINDTLANANNLLRRSAGGLFSGDLAATVGARAGTNLFRTDGVTVLSQADVRTPEGTAAAIAGQGAFATVSSAAYGSALLTGFGGLSPLNFTTLGAGGLVRRQDGVTALTDDAAVTSLGTAAAIAGQGWGATAAEAAASNLLRGNTANIIPDPDHRNPDFWNFPAGASGGDADGGWRRSRWIALANGTYDFSSDYFPVELGATYIVRTRIWNNAGAFSGSFWPLIHIPSIAWYSLKHGAAVNPEVADASNAIVAGGDTGELTWVIANPTGISANANRQWQFRLKGSFTGGPVVVQVEIVRAARIGDSFVLANGQTLPAQNVLVTSEGTAAAIAGQGSGATANNLAGLNATDNGNLTQSLSTSRRLVVSDFSADGRHWTTDFGGTPEAVADPAAEGYSDVASVGRAIRFNGFPRYLQSKGVITPMPGRRYAVIARVRTETAPTGGTITFDVSNINGLNTSFGHGDPTAPTESIPNIPSNVAPAAGAWTFVGRVFSLTASPNAFNAYWRPRLDITATGSGGRAEVASLLILDVTDVPLGRILTGLLRADGTTPVTEALVVTGLGTAAAITGQAWAATNGSEAAASNVRVPIGVNQIVDHDFRFGTTYWRHTPQSGSLSYADTVTAGLRRRTLTGAGVTVGNWIQADSFPDRARFACRAGDMLEASAFLSAANVSAGVVFIQFFDAAGATTGFGFGDSVTPGSTTTSLAAFVRASAITVAPADTAYAMINIRGTASTSAPVLHLANPMLAIANSGQTVPSAWNPGLAYTPGADPTGANTAAAITGQGDFATGNYYEQSTDPGAVANGSFWFKTTTNELFVRRSAAWGKVATIANQNLTITRTNGFVKTRIGSGTITSDSVSFSSTGGSGAGYTYAHELFATYTTGPSPTISSASGSPITASATGAVPGDEVRGFIQTTATDSAGNKSTLTSPLALFCES